MKLKKLTGAEAHALKSDYMRLISEAYDADAVARKERAWEWLFSSPLKQKGYSLEVLAFFDGDVLAAATLILPIEVKLDKENLIFHGPIGIIVSEKHRGAGFRLFRSYFTTYNELYGIPGADRHKLAYRRFGGAVETLLINHFNPLRPGRILARRKGLRGPFRAVLRFADAAWLGLARLKRGLFSPVRGFEIREIDTFGSEFDALWTSASGGYRLVHHRDADFLNWRYRDFPLCAYRRFLLLKAGTPVGYVVLQLETVGERRNVQVSDIFCAKGDEASFRALLHIATGVALEEMADQVILEVPEKLWANNAIRKEGFFLRKPMGDVMICSSDPANRDLLSETVHEYYFCRGDSDQDF